MQPLNAEQGVIWGHRLLLQRDPTASEIEELKGVAASGWGVLRAAYMLHPEYLKRFDRAGLPWGEAIWPLDMREGLIWGYRLLFTQEPNEEQIAFHLPNAQTIADVRRIFLFSLEFEIQGGFGNHDLLDLEVLNRFRPFCTEPAPPGFFNDFLGTTTRLDHYVSSYRWKSGQVEGAPYTDSRGIHGNFEWIGTLRSVLEARGRFVAMEIGAGWAPWLASAAIAAQKLGIDDMLLIAVEGSEEHIEFARQHFRDNGLDPDAHRILHAVCGPNDGIARFPKILQPNEDYGAMASFDGEEVISIAGIREGYDEVRAMSIETLMHGIDHVDLIHMDIQGAERDVIKASIDTLSARVRRMVIGTHSRLIEGELFDLFSEHGWRLEREVPCGIRHLEDGTFWILTDGEQIWRNPRV